MSMLNRHIWIDYLNKIQFVFVAQNLYFLVCFACSKASCCLPPPQFTIDQSCWRSAFCQDGGARKKWCTSQVQIASLTHFASTTLLWCDDSCSPGRSPRGLWSGSSGSDHRWNSVAYSQNFSVSDGKCSENLNSVIASIWKIPYFEENQTKR